MPLTEAQSALDARSSELAIAEADLANIKASISLAEQEALTADDSEVYGRARGEIEFLSHRLGMADAALTACRANVDTATEAVARAEAVADRTALIARRAERLAAARANARTAIDAYVQFCASLDDLDTLQNEDTPDVNSLRLSGDHSSRALTAVDVVLLELMIASPGTIPTAYVSRDMFGRGPAYIQAQKSITSAASPLFELEPASADRVAAFRRSLGDVTSPTPAPPAPTASPVVTEASRVWVSSTLYHDGMPYKVENWAVPPDGREEYRLIVAELSITEQASVVSRSPVTLSNAIHPPIEAKIVTLYNGARLLTQAEKPSLLARAVDVIAGIVAA